jgi:hypothetical protein
MLVLHADEPTLGHVRAPAVGILPGQLSGECPPAHVQLRAVFAYLGPPGVEPFPAGRPEPQRQPVGDVDQILVLDRPSGDLGPGPVVQARDIGARVVDAVGVGLRQRPTGHEVAVSQRAQRLPQPLPGGVEAVVGQCPDTRRPLRVPASDLCRRPAFLQPSLGQSPQRHVVQCGHDQVGARVDQQVAVVLLLH